MGINTKSFDNASDMITFSRASGGYGLTKVSYGDELVTNGTFDTDTSGWTGKTPATISLSVDSGRLKVVSTDLYNGVYQDIATTVGRIYSFTRTVQGGTGTLRFRTFAGPIGGSIDLGGITTIDNGAGSTETFIFVATSTTTRIILQAWNTIANFWLDNISVKEVTYNSSAADATLQLTYHPNDVPRIEYALDGTAKGLLVEEARTNLLTYSEDFTQSFYIKDANVSVTSSNNAAPSGVSNASLITASDNGRIYANNASVTGVVSVFVKAGTFTNLKIKANNVDLVAKTATAGTVEEVGGGWFRYTSEEATAARHFQIQAYPDNTYSPHTQTGTYYIWGAQLEAGAFPTSYIKTTGATATRSADVASITVADFGYNQSEGTVVVEASTVSTAQTNHTDLRIKDGSGFPLASSGSRVGGSSEGTYSLYSPLTTILVNVSSVLTEGSTYKSAYRLADNDVALSVNGSTVATDTSVSFTSLTAEAIEIGDGYGYLNGHIKSIKYYPRRLTDAQLQELTT